LVGGKVLGSNTGVYRELFSAKMGCFSRTEKQKKGGLRMHDSDFNYTGIEVLETLETAKNYNAFLEKLVLENLTCMGGMGVILDIGAGTGMFAKKISSKGYNVRCVEPDPQLRKQIGSIGLRADRDIGDIEDNSIDFIYSLNVLEHIENDEEELKVWHKKLKLEGFVLIYVPAYNVLYSSFDKAVGHYRRYTKKQLVERCEEAGFCIEKAKYVDSLGFFIALLFKGINRDGKLNKKHLMFYDLFLFPVSRLFDFLFSNMFGKNIYIVAKCVK
jgi:SAM-dependent methyltransferase